MPFFSGSRNLAINGGHFTDMNITNNLIGPTGIDILLEASAPGAAYDSSARSSQPRCFPGTRKQYIEDIVHWAIPAVGSAPAPIYWMRGPAGVGKSAIAQTCSEKVKHLGMLGAAFFFSINGARDPQTFFPSIAYQLSTTHSEYRDLIDIKIRRDTTIVHKRLQFQFQYLIDEPLRELEANGKGIGKRITVFVDGLDECEGAETKIEIIRIVAAAVSDSALPICWAFFSRPEPHIEAAFAIVAPHCHKIILPVSREANGEIELYLRNGFENVLRKCNISIQSPWPSAGDVETVVSAANGSFIYATTVLRFVGHLDGLGPRERLWVIMEIILDRRKHPGTGTNAPFAQLDVLYTSIMQRIPKNIFPFAYLLLALISQMGSLGVIMAANILGLSKDQFETVCNHVSAVVHLKDLGKDLKLDPTTDTSCAYTQVNRRTLKNLSQQVYSQLGGDISFYHKSFDDFLLDPARSGSYCVNNSEALSKQFVKLHLAYDRSFCWYGSELILAPGVLDSASSLSYPYTNELVNSLIKAWVYYEAGNEHSENFSQPGSEGRGPPGAERDYRKHLQVFTYLGRVIPAEPDSVTTRLLWGCECRTKSFPGTYIAWISGNDFSKFSVNEFKRVIDQRQQANIIKIYSPNLSSRIKTLFRDKPKKGGIESALYRVGHGEKSIFWYWEINYDLQHYREFRSIRLIEGQKIYQGEDFGSWP